MLMQASAISAGAVKNAQWLVPVNPSPSVMKRKQMGLIDGKLIQRAALLTGARQELTVDAA